MVLFMPILSSTSAQQTMMNRLQMCLNKKHADPLTVSATTESSSLPSLKESGEIYIFSTIFFFFFLILLCSGIFLQKACTERERKPQRPHQDHWEKKMISWGDNIKMGWKWVIKRVEEAAMVGQFTHCVKQKKKFVYLPYKSIQKGAFGTRAWWKTMVLHFCSTSLVLLSYKFYHNWLNIKYCWTILPNNSWKLRSTQGRRAWNASPAGCLCLGRKVGTICFPP